MKNNNNKIRILEGKGLNAIDGFLSLGKNIGIKKEKKDFAVLFSKTITLVVQKKNKEIILKKFKNNIIDKNENLTLITITTEGIWQTPGAVNYISGLFFENEINIEEFMSCYDDTLILIKSEYVEKTMGFLKF